MRMMPCITAYLVVNHLNGQTMRLISTHTQSGGEDVEHGTFDSRLYTKGEAGLHLGMGRWKVVDVTYKMASRRGMSAPQE